MLKHIKRYLFFFLICFILLIFPLKPLNADLDNQLLEKIKQGSGFKYYYGIETSQAFNEEELEKLKHQSTNLTLALGFNHYCNQNYQLALEDWQKVSKKYPKKASIYSLLGWANFQNNNIDKACKYFSKSIFLQSDPLSETEKLSLTEDQLFLIYFCPLTFDEKQKTTKEIYKFRSDFLGPDDTSTLIAALKLTDFLTDEKEIEEILQKIMGFTENENKISSSLTTEALFKLTILYNQNERLDKLEELAYSENQKALKKQKTIKSLYSRLNFILEQNKPKEAQFIATLSPQDLIEMMQKKSQNQKQQLLKERYQFNNDSHKYNLKMLALKNKIKTIKTHQFINQLNLIKQYNEIILNNKSNSADLENENKIIYAHIYPYLKASETKIFSFSSLLTKANEQKIINFWPKQKQNKAKNKYVDRQLALKNINKTDLMEIILEKIIQQTENKNDKKQKALATKALKKLINLQMKQKKDHKALESMNKLLLYLNMIDDNLDLELENKI